MSTMAGWVITAATLARSNSAKLRPFGQDHQGAGALARRVGVVAQLQPQAGQLGVAGVGPGGIERLDDRPTGPEAPQHGQGRRVPQVVGGRLEGQAPRRHDQARPTVGVALGGSLADLVGHQVELPLVGGHDLLEKRKVVAVVLGDADQGAGVLGQARPAPARPGGQVIGADAPVVAHAPDDVDRVGADRLAQVGDGVDERDLGGQEGVAGVLDRLRRSRVGDEHRRLELAVEVGQALGRGLVVAPDHDPVRVKPVVDRVAFPEELGVRHHGRVRPAQGRHHRARRADRDRRLGDHDRARLRRWGAIWPAACSRSEIGRAVGALRGGDTEEHEVGRRRGLRPRRW